jgi:hypothetical protein
MPGKPGNKLVQLPSGPARDKLGKGLTQSPSVTRLVKPGNPITVLY